MLIRRGAGCFKAFFWIFVNLENFLSWPWCHIWWPLTVVPPDFSVITWNFLKPFTLEIGLISSYKMPPCLLSNLIRVLSNSSRNIQKIVNSPYWLSWLTQRYANECMTSCIHNEGDFHMSARIQIFWIFWV